jgi:hypothetical protein
MERIDRAICRTKRLIKWCLKSPGIKEKRNAKKLKTVGLVLVRCLFVAELEDADVAGAHSSVGGEREKE